MRWADIACLPMVLQRALAAKFQIVARSRHPICLNGPLMGEPIQRLGAAAQTGFAGVGCKPFQCFAASTGYALSGCLVCGAAQGGTASGCRCRRTITIAPPQAQRQTGRRGEVDVGGGAADGRKCNTCSRRKLRRLLWCRKPKFLARTNPLGKMCCSSSHTKSAPGKVRVAILPLWASR